MSFDLDDKKMKRAGLDYVKDLDLHVYDSYEEFEQNNPGEYHFFTVIQIYVSLIRTLVITAKSTTYFLVMNMMESLRKS